MQAKLSRALTLGIIGNGLFLLFLLLSLFYHYIFNTSAPDIIVKLIEIIAYFVEVGGFTVLVIADYFICSAVRMRKAPKIAFSLYLVMEAFLMFCELNGMRVQSFYAPYSLALYIVHVLASSAVCFTFVYFDPYKKAFELLVIGCVFIILLGLIGNYMDKRIYFSIIANALSFLVMFAGMKIMIKREIIEIDCHGDRAREVRYKSGFFED